MLKAQDMTLISITSIVQIKVTEIRTKEGSSSDLTRYGYSGIFTIKAVRYGI